MKQPYLVQDSSGENELPCYDMGQDDSVTFLSNLSDPSTRMDVLQWVDEKGYPIRLNVGNDAPESFISTLSPIPNRELSHTVGQPVVFSHRLDCQHALREILRKLGNDLQQIINHSLRAGGRINSFLEMYRGKIESQLPATTDDISMFNFGLMTMATTQKGALPKLIGVMDEVTSNIRHSKHTWDEETRGTVLILPEEDILHRRMGQDTGQVVWHADTFKGFIIFCLLNNQTIPHRVLFNQNGEIQ